MTLIFDFKWFSCAVISTHYSQSPSKSKHSSFRRASCLRNKESNDTPYLVLKRCFPLRPNGDLGLGPRERLSDNERLMTIGRTLSSWEIMGLGKHWLQNDEKLILHRWGYYWHIDLYRWTQIELISSRFHRFVPHFHLPQEHGLEPLYERFPGYHQADLEAF